VAAAAACFGAGTIVLEIGLTRLFSVLLFYHYVFLVLAVALLGLGLGGAIAAVVPDRERRATEYAAGVGVLAALAAVAAAVLSARVLPVGVPLAHGAVALVPFLFVGMAMPFLFAAAPAATARVYGADLIGAAIGAALAYALLYLGAIPAVLGAGTLFAAAALVVGGRRSGQAGRVVFFALVALLFTLSATVRTFDVDLGRLAAGKPLGQWLGRGQASVVRTTWDPFGRVDVVSSPSSPLERVVFVDGAAGSPLPRYPSDSGQESKRLLELGAFPYRLTNVERALVVGSGGGIGVLYALLGGASDVTAVEVSRGVIEAVRADGEYAGFLYDRPGVTVVADEGRSFLDRDDGRYDVIDLSLVVSLNSARGGYALTENYLFTTEAFASVFAHLADDGLAAVRLYDDPTLTRAFVTAAAAIRETAGGDAAAVRHLAVLFNPEEAEGGAFYPVLLMSKRPMTEGAAQELTARAESLGHTVMFAPFVREDGPFGQVARGEVTIEGLQDELAGGVFDPPTDARPFFFEMEEGLPRQLVNAWIAVAVVVGLMAIGGGLAARARGSNVATPRRRGSELVYFAVLGLAFMLIELSLMARLTLFLGHPTVAVTVVLAALLLASGTGSMMSQRLSPRALRTTLVLAAAATAILALAVPVAIEWARDSAGGWSLGARAAVAVLALLPLGAAMGTLFPSGLRLTAGDAALPWAVNGMASVIGAVLATTIALEYGYPTETGTGAALYGGLALVGLALLHQSSISPRSWRRLGVRGRVRSVETVREAAGSRDGAAGAAR